VVPRGKTVRLGAVLFIIDACAVQTSTLHRYNTRLSRSLRARPIASRRLTSYPLG
jgi:hypothetical protein